MSFQVLAKEIIDEFVQRIWVNKNGEIQRMEVSRSVLEMRITYKSRGYRFYRNRDQRRIV